MVDSITVGSPGAPQGCTEQTRLQAVSCLSNWWKDQGLSADLGITVSLVPC